MGAGMTNEEIHNIWLHMSGKSEGLLEAGATADLPVMFAKAILEFDRMNRKWVGLTDEERTEIRSKVQVYTAMDNIQYGLAIQRATEAKLKEKNT
jgi:hypothetical protein